MSNPIKVIDLDLSQPLTDIENLEGYQALKVLVRLHNRPLGYVNVPVVSDRCPAQILGQAILAQHSRSIIRYLLGNGLVASPEADGLRLNNLLDISPPVYNGPWPLVTVAVCTRDRTDDLTLCLEALMKLDYPNLEILVVDNAPSNDASEQLVRTKYPSVRYVCEVRPGLNWARNRAIIEAKGEIIAYTDDDVIVDPAWASALVKIFAGNPEVMAVTGLVVPYELETEAQVLFEIYGGFGRGFERKWYHGHDSHTPVAIRYGGAGEFGTGANMAYRRSLFERIGYFDPALDVGTVTNGGGDLEMFFRVLKEGYTLVYEPGAIVRHRHRRDYAQLRLQLANNGLGFYSYLVRSSLAYPDERLAFILLGLWWLWWWDIRRLLISLVHPTRFPRDLILAELRGSLVGLGRYQQARRTAAQIEATFGSLPQAVVQKHQDASQETRSPNQNSIGVRTIDLSHPFSALTDVTNYTSVRVFVLWHNRLPLGSVDIVNHRQPISTTRLAEAIVDNLGHKLLEPNRNLDSEGYRDSHLPVNLSTLYQKIKEFRNKQDELSGLYNYWTKYLAWEIISTSSPDSYSPEGRSVLHLRYKLTPEETKNPKPARLPAEVSVSVVVATHDRPDDLRQCLRCLVTQESSRPVEIIVVDNKPASGLTPPVVAEFPEVVLVRESRQGLSYARNAGISASQGDIVVTTDDDATMPPDWLEKLVVPFSRPEVMIVTGNVLPLELETTAQRLFEIYGGLGRGFERFEVDKDWFDSFRLQAVRTWRLGATANAAFRATIFSHPQIGLMDEALGVGTPTGCSEDAYLFYRVLKAGYTLVYEPTAYVWHKHRRHISAFHNQIYNYSKGHVAYHLTTLLRDHDLRGLVRVSVELLLVHLWRSIERLFGGSNYPLSLILLEIAGNLVGPWALWRSRRRVKREGRSQPYIPVSRRSVVRQELPVG